MRIEVIGNHGAPQKEKGDLIEKLSAILLKAQNYKVTENVRLTACELDLYCEHNVSGKRIYVECKAHRDKLSANVLTNILGVITLKSINEGWLISTGPLGKDANGFLVEWQKKPPGEQSKLSIYTPDKVIDALQNANIISSPPSNDALSILHEENSVGEWTLLISPWGYFWACSCLENGVPVGVTLFNSKNGSRIIDKELLLKLSVLSYKS